MWRTSSEILVFPFLSVSVQLLNKGLMKHSLNFKWIYVIEYQRGQTKCNYAVTNTEILTFPPLSVSVQ